VTRIADMPDGLTKRVSRALAVLDAIEAIEAESAKADGCDRATISHDEDGAWSATLGGGGVDSGTLSGALLLLRDALGVAV
jgi:hypothetical protein